MTVSNAPHLSCFATYWNLAQEGKSWPSMRTRLQLWQKLSILGSTGSMAGTVPELAKEIRANWSWSWRIKMMLIWPPLCDKVPWWLWEPSCVLFCMQPLPVHTPETPLENLCLPNQQLGDSLGDPHVSPVSRIQHLSYPTSTLSLKHYVFEQWAAKPEFWFQLWLGILLAVVCWGFIIYHGWAFCPHHPAKQKLSSPFYRWKNWNSELVYPNSHS